MTPDALWAAGTGLLGVSAALLLASARLYRALDVRGALDDLAGRRRSAGSGSSGGARRLLRAPSHGEGGGAAECGRKRPLGAPSEFLITRKDLFMSGLGGFEGW